ncbi:hypothetical protein C8F01DRAFT_961774, partial [Mycena amicta]
GAESDKDWKAGVRIVFEKLTERNTAKEFADYQPVDASTVGKCNDGQVEPADNIYMLDFSEGWANSTWNVCIIEKMVKILKDEPLSAVLPEVDDEYLKALFHGKIKRAQEAWRHPQQRELETEEEARVRTEEYNERRAAATESRARKQAKFDSRSLTIGRILELKLTDGADDVEVWKWLQKLLKRL